MGKNKTSHRYFFRQDTAWMQSPPSIAYYLSDRMSLTKEGTFELCGGVVYNSLEEIANSVVKSLFVKDNRGYLRDEIILYNSLNNNVKEKPFLSASRKKIGVEGARSDIDDLLILQRILGKKINQELQKS